MNTRSNKYSWVNDLHGYGYNRFRSSSKGRVDHSSILAKPSRNRSRSWTGGRRYRLTSSSRSSAPGGHRRRPLRRRLQAVAPRHHRRRREPEAPPRPLRPGPAPRPLPLVQLDLRRRRAPAAVAGLRAVVGARWVHPAHGNGGERPLPEQPHRRILRFPPRCVTESMRIHLGHRRLRSLPVRRRRRRRRRGCRTR